MSVNWIGSDWLGKYNFDLAKTAVFGESTGREVAVVREPSHGADLERSYQLGGDGDAQLALQNVAVHCSVDRR